LAVRALIWIKESAISLSPLALFPGAHGGDLTSSADWRSIMHT